jgi:hypothetical protein
MIFGTRHRSDLPWFAGLLKENQAYKMALLVFLISNLALCALLFREMKRGKEIYAFDSSTGRTYQTGKISQRHVDNMVLFATKTFSSDFLNYDYLTIEQARLASFRRLSPPLQQKFKDELSSEEPIKEAIAGKARYELQFLTEPALIARAHPNYRVFTKVKRIIRFADGRTSESEHNLRITWKMMESTPDRPDGLYVTDLERISPNDKETLNAILNQIQ